MADRTTYPCRIGQRCGLDYNSGGPVLPGRPDSTIRKIEGEEGLHLEHRVKSEKAVRVSILLVQQEDLTEVKRVVVVVPVKWKLIEKIEAVRAGEAE